SNSPLRQIPPPFEGVECYTTVHLNGYFINPHNPKQIIIHLLEIEPCGFEGEDHFSNLLIGANLN
ncbi:MAG: hypothetical protein ACK452_06005, partial [Bacteroidota bacterium]